MTAESKSSPERFPATVYVALLLTHGRSNRLFLTRHYAEGQWQWGPIAGAIEEKEGPWGAVVREAKEEANISPYNIIFVTNRDPLEPHVALLPGSDKGKIRAGLIYSATYSGPKLSIDGWNIVGDRSVDMARFFTWQEVCSLLEESKHIYVPEFNIPQLIRWLLYSPVGVKRACDIDQWLTENQDKFPGLSRLGDKNMLASYWTLPDIWRYIPPYNDWVKIEGIHGRPERTNFARARYHKMIKANWQD